jgi:hypothetical protein
VHLWLNSIFTKLGLLTFQIGLCPGKTVPGPCRPYCASESTASRRRSSADPATLRSDPQERKVVLRCYYPAAHPVPELTNPPPRLPETLTETMPEAQPPPPPPRAMMLADLNVDPPESDGEDHPPTPKPSPAIAAAAVVVPAAVPVPAADSSTRYECKGPIRSDCAGLLLLLRSCPLQLQIVRNWALGVCRKSYRRMWFCICGRVVLPQHGASLSSCAEFNTTSVCWTYAHGHQMKFKIYLAYNWHTQFKPFNHLLGNFTGSLLKS